MRYLSRACIVAFGLVAQDNAAAAGDPAAEPTPVRADPAAAPFRVQAGIAPILPADTKQLRLPTATESFGLGTGDAEEIEIMVYGTRLNRDFPDARDSGLSPTERPAALTHDIRILPPQSCPNAAYRTIAGQPAAAGDLVGFLGSGDCL